MTKTVTMEENESKEQMMKRREHNSWPRKQRREETGRNKGAKEKAHGDNRGKDREHRTLISQEKGRKDRKTCTYNRMHMTMFKHGWHQSKV